MPVLRAAGSMLTDDTRPSWCELSGLGTVRFLREGSRFDRHFHDCDEYWLVAEGRALIATEGIEFEIGPGDVVCTRAGDEHDILAIEEDLVLFWLEDRLVGEGRPGHLHRTPEDARGHDVAKGFGTV